MDLVFFTYAHTHLDTMFHRVRIPESVEISSITSTSATVQFTLTDPIDVTRPEGFVVMYGLISGQLNSNSSVISSLPPQAVRHTP